MFNVSSKTIIFLFFNLFVIIASSTMNAPTPHIAAKNGDFAKTVLMPGDPLRAKFIAEKYLKDPILVNNVRGVQGYTGTYKGKRVSVMASGMGIPSIGIYSHELYSAFDVENIIRVGSAGAIHENINLKDIVVATGACTNSNYGMKFGLPGTISGVASYEILEKINEAKKILGYPNEKVKFGQVLSSDTFYTELSDLAWAKIGVQAVEMEAYGLYLNAARLGKRAAAICTISDQLVRKEFLSAEERQLSFHEMIVLALETAVLLD